MIPAPMRARYGGTLSRAWRSSRVRVVVIDPEDAEAVTRLAELVSEHDRGGKGEQWIADVAAALREFANPTPPKPDEPQGLGAVVVDSDGYYWVYTGHRDIDDSRWWMCGTVSKLKFDAIAAVEVLSEGVTP